MASAQPLVGAERDEITQLVSRIKSADARTRQPVAPRYAVPAPVSQAETQWAEDWQLPKEVLDYFIIEQV
ncbi:MAG: hypothetical protein GC129_05385 [Proteobacteria bacterium]|nr:hypothetical protein [Pseudomonadota bacterium]